ASSNVTVGDGYVIGGAGESQAKRTLQANAIVPGRVDAAIGNTHVPAAVNVDTIAVGVDRQIIDCQVIHAGGEDCEVSAMKNGEIAQRGVAAILQADSFVANACGQWNLAPAAAQALPPDVPWTDDKNVFEVLAAD